MILFNKYLLLIYLIFILSFISIWNSDNILNNNNNYSEQFSNQKCPKKYMDNLLNIRKSSNLNNQNINHINYDLNSIDIDNNKHGSQIYKGNFPKESNYNFSIKKIKTKENKENKTKNSIESNNIIEDIID